MSKKHVRRGRSRTAASARCWERVVKIGNVGLGDPVPSLVDELLDAVAALAADDGRFELVPVGDALLPDGPLGPLPDAVGSDESVLDAHALGYRWAVRNP